MNRLSNPMRNLALTWLAASCLAIASPGLPHAALIPNPDFTEGVDTPVGWTLTGPQGTWRNRGVLQVDGDGTDSSYWRTADCPLTPGAIYHFQFRANHKNGAGSAIAGPTFANRDYRLSESSNWHGHYFIVPENTAGHYYRLGQWHATGSILYNSVRVNPALPVHQQFGPILLGEGESIEQGIYTFAGSFNHPGANFHRPLHRATAGFNSTRWTFGNQAEVIYRFEVPGHKFQSGQVTFMVNHHVRGSCLAEIGRDPSHWHPVTRQNEVGQATAPLPPSLFPAPILYLRLKTGSANASFQVDAVEFRGALDGRPAEGHGETAFVDLMEPGEGIALGPIVLQKNPEAGKPTLVIQATNLNPAAAPMRVATRDTSRPPQTIPSPKDIEPGQAGVFHVQLPAGKPGDRRIHLSLHSGSNAPAKATLQMHVPDYYRTDYGQLLGEAGDQAAVWWCEASRKIPRHRPPPSGPPAAAALAAARNDFEAVQIVVRPSQPLKNLSATASPLQGPDSARIPARHISVSRVAYHFVRHPTDQTGVRDWWPDALPPLRHPIHVEAGRNQPFWVLIHVPEDARAGDYEGHIQLQAEGWSAKVPLHLHVWDFTLPKRNHLETAFGFSPGNVFRYHQLQSETDKRTVLDLYFQNFADHRISPYNPAPLDPIKVRFRPEADPPRAELDFTAFDAAMHRAVDRFHFTGLRLPVQGMGGGTFHSRRDPGIAGYGENTPQYQALFSSYVRQLENHFRQKNWLNLPYVYWFDEPDPKDYAFVRRGMERLHQYAPGLRRMLTEQPGPELAGAVDIWCPVSHNFERKAAEKRYRQGEDFWWYVCTGPKAPYCTLFIDHPATELRVWLWQTWQRGISGILVWQSTYWTSGAAFPNQPQNPYNDPMGYVSGYSTPAGVQRHWGNGDGRFLYPPESAAVPGLSGEKPVLEPPVSSIRWEMLREGIEDYEYLWLLRDLIRQHRHAMTPRQIKHYESLLRVPPGITSSMTSFTTDPHPIYERRSAVAEAIEMLGNSGP